MIDKIKDLAESISDRIKNPIILTFIVVWCVHHWKFLFTLVNFDEYYNLDMKSSRLETYIEDHCFWWGMLWKPLLIAVLSTIGYFVLSIAMKFLNVIYNRVLVFVMRKVNAGREFVAISEYNILDIQLQKSQSRVVELQRKNTDLADAIKTEEGKSLELINQKANLIIKNSTLENDIMTISQERDLMKQHLDDLRNPKKTNESENNDSLYLRKMSILQLKQQLKKEIYAPKSEKQWIYNDTCLVHDYIFESKFQIAIDTYCNKGNWQIELFGRDEESKKYLMEIMLGEYKFIPDIGPDNEMRGDRIILRTRPINYSPEGMYKDLKQFLSMIETYKANHP